MINVSIVCFPNNVSVNDKEIIIFIQNWNYAKSRDLLSNISIVKRMYVKNVKMDPIFCQLCIYEILNLSIFTQKTLLVNRTSYASFWSDKNEIVQIIVGSFQEKYLIGIDYNE